jgi:Putative lumazine-binding
VRERSDATEADRAAILAAVADYMESWLDGDAERMASCLHPQLVKRAVDHEAGGWVIDDMTRDDMVAATAAGRGRQHDRPYAIVRPANPPRRSDRRTPEGRPLCPP